MEAVREYLTAQQLAGIVPLPDSFAGKKLEITIIPVDDDSVASHRREAIAALRGPVPGTELTLDAMREERWNSYQNLA